MGLPAGFDPVKGTFSGVSAPKIQSNYNTISSGSYAGSYYTYSSRNYNLWDRFNDAIKSVGNWIDDIIEPVSGWITILGIIIGAIGLICWIFDDSNILYIILRFIGACFYWWNNVLCRCNKCIHNFTNIESSKIRILERMDLPNCIDARNWSLDIFSLQLALLCLFSDAAAN